MNDACNAYNSCSLRSYSQDRSPPYGRSTTWNLAKCPRSMFLENCRLDHTKLGRRKRHRWLVRTDDARACRNTDGRDRWFVPHCSHWRLILLLILFLISPLRQLFSDHACLLPLSWVLSLGLSSYFWLFLFGSFSSSERELFAGRSYQYRFCIFRIFRYLARFFSWNFMSCTFSH